MKKFNKFAAGGILNLAAKTGIVFFLPTMKKKVWARLCRM